MADKEVATKGTKSRVREESFGSAPEEVKLGKGTMPTFGFRKNSGVWPKAVDSVDQKSGFPENRSK